MDETEQSGGRTTQVDVARLAGVSQAVVSYVINDTEAVQSIPLETRQRVKDAIEELRYIPNVMARRLRLNKTHTIGGVIPDITNSFYPEFQRGVQTAVEQAGYDLILYNTDGTAAGERKCLDSMLQGRVDGIVGVFFSLGARELKPLLDHDVSIVRLESGPKRPGVLPLDSAYVDNAKASRAATEHLIEKGHTRIGMLTSSEGPASVRERGYREALTLNDLGPPLTSSGSFNADGGYDAMRMLLEEDEDLSAIVAANDLMALGAMMAIREAGLSVPNDIAVVGFDDIEVARLMEPSLTSIAQSQCEIGRRAAEMLLERLDGRVDGPARHLEMPFELIERQSTSGTRRDSPRRNAAR